MSSAETSATKCRKSPSWPIALGVDTCALPRRVIATSQNSPGSLSGASFLPAHPRGNREVDEAHLPARVEPLVRALLAGQQPPHDLVGGPRDHRHRGDPEPLVDLGPPRVLDPGDHPLDAVVLPADPGGEDVRVVAARDRGQGSGSFDAGLRRARRGRSRVRRSCRPRTGLPTAGTPAAPCRSPRRCGPSVRGWRRARSPPCRIPRSRRARVSLRGAAMLPRPGGPLESRLRHLGLAHCPLWSCKGPGRKRGVAFVKRILVGRPLATTEMEHQRIPKTIALAVFSSDAISSTAYATEEILFVVAVGAVEPRARTRHARPDRYRGCRPPRDRRHVVPPDDLRLPERRRQLRGEPREPRREPVAHRRRVTARRLHPHRRGVDLGRRRRHRVDSRVPRLGEAPGAARARC